VIARQGETSCSDPIGGESIGPALDARLIGEIGLHAAVVMQVLAKIESIAGRAEDDALAREIACVVEALHRRLQTLIERTRRSAE
jgi:hypothetical protein